MKITEANLIDFYVLINRRKITKMSLVPQSAGRLALKEKMTVLVVWLYPLGEENFIGMNYNVWVKCMKN